MTTPVRRTVRQRWYLCGHCGGKFIDPQERSCSAACERALSGEPPDEDVDPGPFLVDDEAEDG